MPTHRKKPTVMLLFGWNDPEGFAAITRHAREQGWHLELRAYFTGNLPDPWHGDGILYTKGNRERIDDFVIRQAARCPVVSLSANLPPGLAVPVVSTDNAEAGRMAARHLIAQGHRDFAFYSPVHGTVTEERRSGFEETIRKHGLRLHPLIPHPTGTNPSPWPVLHKRLSAQLRTLPHHTGVLALDDLMAADLIETAMDIGLRIPDDLSVMGMGNLGAVCQCSPVPITSIDLRSEDVAHRGAELLGHLMAGKGKAHSTVRIPPGDLIVRESSDTTIVHDPRLAAAIAHIHKNLRRTLSLDQIAEAAGVSRRTLYHLFHEDLGLTPAEFIKRQRTQLASRLLHEQPDATRSEVSVSAGFTCTRTMNRLMHRKSPPSPSRS